MGSNEVIQEHNTSEFSMSSENLLDDDLRAPICKQEEDFDQSSFSESHFISTILKKQK